MECHSTSKSGNIFNTHIGNTGIHKTQVTCLASLRSEAQVHICLPVHGAPWWMLLQHSTVLQFFFLVECGIVRFLSAMCVLELRASSSSPGYLCAKFCFFCYLHCWASPWRRNHIFNHSITHSPSLFDVPETQALALRNSHTTYIITYH